jgi:hypothetical protein
VPEVCLRNKLENACACDNFLIIKKVIKELIKKLKYSKTINIFNKTAYLVLAFYLFIKYTI